MKKKFIYTRFIFGLFGVAQSVLFFSVTILASTQTYSPPAYFKSLKSRRAEPFWNCAIALGIEFPGNGTGGAPATPYHPNSYKMKYANTLQVMDEFNIRLQAVKAGSHKVRAFEVTKVMQSVHNIFRSRIRVLFNLEVEGIKLEKIRKRHLSSTRSLGTLDYVNQMHRNLTHDQLLVRQDRMEKLTLDELQFLLNSLSDWSSDSTSPTYQKSKDPLWNFFDYTRLGIPTAAVLDGLLDDRIQEKMRLGKIFDQTSIFDQIDKDLKNEKDALEQLEKQIRVRSNMTYAVVDNAEKPFPTLSDFSEYNLTNTTDGWMDLYGFVNSTLSSLDGMIEVVEVQQLILDRRRLLAEMTPDTISAGALQGPNQLFSEIRDHYQIVSTLKTSYSQGIFYRRPQVRSFQTF